MLIPVITACDQDWMTVTLLTRCVRIRRASISAEAVCNDNGMFWCTDLYCFDYIIYIYTVYIYIHCNV